MDVALGAIAGALAGAAAAAGLILRLWDWRKWRAWRPGRAEDPPTAPAGGADGGRLDRLVRGCIGTADLARGHQPAIWDRLTAALASVGVVTLVPDGQPFDREQFEAVDRVPAPDRSLHLIVASTDLAGYRYDDRLIRRPQVVVYRYAGGDHMTL